MPNPNEYLMPYFTKGDNDIGESCEKIGKRGHNRNPWTGRWLRKTVRGKLKHDCDTWRKKHIHHSLITYWRGDKEYLIDSSLNVGAHLGHGKYWSVYAGAPRRALKIRVLWTENDYNKTAAEKDVYLLGARHKVSPKVYDWYYIKDATVMTAARHIPQQIVGIAVAEVERYASEGSKRIRKTPEFAELRKNVEKMEEQHGIEIDEAFVDRNILVSADEKKVVTGDLGNWKPVTSDYSLSCSHHSK